MSDFLIIGGGVIGLLLARELLADGASVTVIDSGKCGGEASWAGGGIVSPLYPWRYNDAVTALATWAQDYYPELAQSLFLETGLDPELQACGLMMLDADDAQQALAWARRTGRTMTAEDQVFIYECEPALAPGYRSCVWMPEVANIRNPRLVKALTASVQASPAATVIEQTSVTAFNISGRGQVASVELSGAVEDTRNAGQFIVCAGAWTGRLVSRYLTACPGPMPVRPVKGQMLLFETPRRLLDRIVLTNGRYLIPRRDNHLLVGSTLEYSEFNKQTTDEALQTLYSSACEMVPALREIPVKQQWAGLRPGAPDGIPFIGPVPGYNNLHVNAGHFRNGLVLAPASARLMADQLMGRPTAIDPAPYLPAQRMVLPVV